MVENKSEVVKMKLRDALILACKKYHYRSLEIQLDRWHRSDYYKEGYITLERSPTSKIIDP